MAPNEGPPPPPGPSLAAVLTQVVRVAKVEHVAAVHVVVEGLLDQVLRLVPGQLGHPGGGLREFSLRCTLPSIPAPAVPPTSPGLNGWGGGR